MEARAAEKIGKYKKHRIIVDGDNSRSLVVVAFSIFGRINEEALKHIRQLSFRNGRDEQEAARFREYWLQRLSCALQRGLASFYKYNLSIFRGDMRFDKDASDSIFRRPWDYSNNFRVRSGSGLTWRRNFKSA